MYSQRAKSSGVSQTALLKMLLKGDIPKEKPDDRFYETMRDVYEMTTTATRLLEKSHHLGVLDKDTVIEEILNTKNRVFKNGIRYEHSIWSR